MYRKVYLLIFLFIPFFVVAQIPTQGLIAYYPFCGDATDHGPNGFDLTVSNAVLTTDKFGAANNAYEFNGVNAGMIYNTSFALGNEYTISCWVLPYSMQDGSCVYNGNSNLDGVGIVYSGGAGILSDDFILLAGNVCYCVQQQSPINVWHHAVARRTVAGGLELFLDNVNVGSSTSTPNPPNGAFHVGYDNTNGTNPFDGKIDEVIVYNRALTNLEITQLYGLQCGSYTSPVTPASATIGSGGNVTFSVPGLGSNYQWQEDFGGGWANLSNGGIYSGVTTETLTLTNVPFTLNNASYRCIYTDISCCLDTSDVAVLTVINLAPSACAVITNLADTIEVCKNSTYQLNPNIITGGNFAAIDTTWSPATGLSDPNISNPIATLGTSNQTYVLTVNSQTSNNLVVNGDFSAGATGFTSDYIPGTGGAFGLLSNEGQYAVDTDPNLTHMNFASYGDHTSGTGNMMVVNGSGIANTNVWCQTIAVTPNTDYNFSSWFSTCVSSSPAILQFAINGTQLGTPATAPFATGVWAPFNATWNSGTSTSATICITNQNIATSGNDFALDDIEFRGICTVKDTVTFKVINLEVAIDTAYRFGCASDTVDFTTILNAQPADLYFWDFGDGTSDTGFVLSHVYLLQGTYNVRLIAFKNGCTDTASIQVNTVHFVNAAFTVSADSICMGESIDFTSTTASTYATSIVWDFGDGSPTETGVNPQHTYPAPGNYTVTLIASDVIPCFDTAFTLIYVADTPAVSMVLNDSLLCEGEGITIYGTSSSGYNSFIWDFGDGTFSNTQLSPLHAWDTSGVYTVSLTVDYALCPDKTVSANVTVFAMPVVNLGPDTTLCAYADPITVSNIAFDPSYTYTWNTGDGNVQSVLARHHGVYALTVTAPSGCSASDSMTIHKDCYMDIPNAFTPNGDGLNDYFLPRQLLGKNITEFYFALYNRWGQMLFESYKLDGRGWDGKFNGVDQPMGVFMYLLDVELDGNRREKYKGNVTLIR